MTELSYKLAPLFSSKPHEIKNEQTGEIAGYVKRNFKNIFEKLVTFRLQSFFVNYTVTDSEKEEVIFSQKKSKGLTQNWTISKKGNKFGKVHISTKKNLKKMQEGMTVTLQTGKKIAFTSGILSSSVEILCEGKLIAAGQRKGFNSYKLSVHDDEYDWKVILGSWTIFCVLFES